MLITGTAGERECDGWVEWTTSDESNSYLPALHCGHFEIVVARGRLWGALSSDHGVAITSSHGEGVIKNQSGILAVEEEEGDSDPLHFVWNQGALIDACGTIAEALEHPAPENVRAAASELYFALLQIAARRGSESLTEEQ